MQHNDKVLILGGIIIDHYMLVDCYPERGQDICVHDTFQKVGGCAINVGITLKNLGCESFIVSTVGNDHWGNDITLYLKDNGFKTDCIRTAPNERSGYCLAVVEKSGERTFLTYKGCEGFFSAEMIPEELIGEIKFIYLTGYYLLNSSYHGELVFALNKLKNAGSKLMFDPGPLVEDIEDAMLLSVLKISDVVVPNYVEVEKMCRKLNIQGSFHDWCLGQGVELVVVKMGGQGVQVWGKGIHYSTTSYKVKSADTTGAGDSFAGGLIYGLLNYRDDIKASVDIASACGAITTTFMGPHGKFGIEDVMLIMRDGKETE